MEDLPMLRFAALLGLIAVACADPPKGARETETPSDGGAAGVGGAAGEPSSGGSKAPGSGGSGQEGGAAGEDGAAGAPEAGSGGEAGEIGEGGAGSGGEGGEAPSGGTGGTAGSAGSGGAGGSSGSGGKGGSGGSGNGPVVVWSTSHETTKAINRSPETTTYFGGQFRLNLDLGPPDHGTCTAWMDADWVTDGWSGTKTLPLTPSQAQCFRESYDCSQKARIAWHACEALGCSSMSNASLVDVVRPACSGIGIDSLDLVAVRLVVETLDYNPTNQTLFLKQRWELLANP